jgi:hypothetical protein
MADPDLFALGCGVTFLFLGGVYELLRRDFLAVAAKKTTRSEVEAGPVRAVAPDPVQGP